MQRPETNKGQELRGTGLAAAAMLMSFMKSFVQHRTSYSSVIYATLAFYGFNVCNSPKTVNRKNKTHTQTNKNALLTSNSIKHRK